MSSLMSLLGKSDSSAKPSAESEAEGPGGSPEAFDDSAAQAMDCLKNNDTAGFSEALRSCIELSQ